MSLRKRTILTVCIALACLMLGVDLIARYVWMRGFRDLEDQAVRDSLIRVGNAFEREIEVLVRQTADWAEWDDMYAFVQQPTADFINSNFVPSAFENLNLGFAVVLNEAGKVVYAEGYDLLGRRKAPFPEPLAKACGVGQSTRPFVADGQPICGVLVADRPVLFSARPIRDSLRKMPPRGVFIVGRYVDEHEVRRLASVTHLSLSVHAWGAGDLPVEVARAQELLGNGRAEVVWPNDQGHVDGFCCVRDYHGRPALSVRIRQNRDIYRHGQITQNHVVIAVVLACVVFGALTVFLVETFALRRIRGLSRAVREITRSNDFSGRLQVTGHDEIRSLACDINRLLYAVVRSRDRAGESRRMLETLLSNLPGMAYRCRNDRDWTMELVSEGCQALTGHPAADLLDNAKVNYSRLIHPADRERVWEAVQAAVAARRPFESVYRIITSSGETRWVWEQGRGVFDDAGQLTCLEGYIADVTEAKQNEQELEQARIAAVAANQSKSAFLANMSHEIRTPMTAILGYADLMLGEPIEPAIKEGLSIIRQNGEHLLEIINDILDLSKIEANKLQVEKVDCSIASILGGIESLMMARARQKNIGFTLEYATPVPRTIQSDPTRLRQILLNLVGNAVKFTCQGAVRVTAAIVDYGGPDAKLCVDVIDTGVGMTAEQAQAIFQPFSQADVSTTRRFGGTGLGLAISRRLASRLGGTIELVSTLPDQGSTFRLTLQVGSLDGAEMWDPRQQELLEETPQVAHSPDNVCLAGRRVLLAEDGLDNQRLIRRILERQGVEVVAVEDGRSAVEHAMSAQAAAQPFDLILMDMQMPVMDGYDAVKLLRRQGYRRPIVALTAYAMSSDRERCLACGCDEYQTKPIDRGALLALVARMIAAGREPVACAARCE